MVYNPCGCWNLKDGGVTIGIWSVAYSCIEFCLFGWQIYDIKEERNKVAMWRQPSIGAVDPLAARWNVYYNQYAETDLEQHYLRVFIIQIINLIVDFFVFGSSIALMVGIHTGSKHLIWPWFPCMSISICTTLAYCIMWWAYRVESYWVVLTVVEMASVIINIYCVWCISAAYRLIVSGKAFQTVNHNEKKHMLVSGDGTGAMQSKILPTTQVSAGQLNQAYMQTPQTMAPNTIYGTKQPHFDSSYSNSIAQKQTKIDFNLPAPYAYQQEPLNSIQLPNGIRLVPMPMPPPQYQQSVVDVGPLIGASGKTDFIKTWQQGVEDAAIGVQSFPSEEPPGYNKQDISDHFTSVSKSTRRSSRDDSSKADRKHRHRRHSRRRSPSTQYDSDSRTTATKTSKTSKSSRSRRSRSRRHSSSEQSESSESSTETDSYTTGKGRSKSVTNVSERTYRTGQSSKSSSKKHRRRRSDSGTEETESEGISTTVVSTAKSHSSRTSASSKQPKSKSSSNRRHRSHSVDDRDEIRERRSEKSERRRERNSPKEVKKKSGRYKDGGSSITSRSYQSRSVDELSHLPSSEPISPGVPLNIPMSAVQTGLYQSGRNPPATPPKPLTSQSQLPYVTPPRVAQPPQFNRSTSAGVKMTLNNSGSSTQPPTTPPGQSGSGQTAVYTSSGSSGAGGIPRPQRLNSSQNDPTADNKVYISTAV